MDNKHRHHVCSLFTLGGREGAAPGPEGVPTYQGLTPNPTWSRDGRLVQTIACHKYRITPNDLSPESSWCQLQLQAPFAWLGHWLFACIFDIIHQHDNAQNNTSLPFYVLCGRLLDEKSSELSRKTLKMKPTWNLAKNQGRNGNCFSTYKTRQHQNPSRRFQSNVFSHSLNLLWWRWASNVWY